MNNVSSPPPNPVRWSVTCRGRTVVTEPCRTAFQAVELAGAELADPERGAPHFSECVCTPVDAVMGGAGD